MEEKKFKRTTVTAALPYANGGVHIGHLAGVYVPADIYVRYLRLKKEEVIFYRRKRRARSAHHVACQEREHHPARCV